MRFHDGVSRVSIYYFTHIILSQSNSKQAARTVIRLNNKQTHPEMAEIGLMQRARVSHCLPVQGTSFNLKYYTHLLMAKVKSDGGGALCCAGSGCQHSGKAAGRGERD